MQNFKKIYRREFLKWPEKTNFELNYPKHAVAMVTDFQRKSSNCNVLESIVNVYNKFRFYIM